MNNGGVPSGSASGDCTTRCRDAFKIQLSSNGAVPQPCRIHFKSPLHHGRFFRYYFPLDAVSAVALPVLTWNERIPVC